MPETDVWPARAEAGEDIIVTRNVRPVARLTHLAAMPVIYGDLAGLAIPTDLASFDLPEEIMAGFEGCPCEPGASPPGPI